jgi:hypothetical protein
MVSGDELVATEEIQDELVMPLTLAGQIETVPQQQGAGNDPLAVDVIAGRFTAAESMADSTRGFIIQIWEGKEMEAKKIRQETQGDFIRPFDTNIFF